MKFTYHAIEERTDRLLFIATEVGWGKPIATHYLPTQARWLVLTDTGVMLVKNQSCDTLITAFIATFGDAYFCCDGDIPRNVRNLLAHYKKKNIYKKCDNAVY